ncbi:MAG: bifunctional DNA-formamidopyrimidine glycosylase/DNA-(apurinic or apyrimidinic site) lyase [Bryobacterales bacterium]|nr:bifunctional DNA-formamidopyrimidine glycosylase/DNA-(apurinic or apyrimidinic site) lyase [Bryobacterales bacterium]
MPELPEVENVVRTLAPRLCGCRIERVRMSASRVFRGRQGEIEASLPGCRVLAVRRYGKNILIELDRCLLRVHLGMTGKLLFDAEQATHPRATLWLCREAEAETGVLIFDDIRQFGRFETLPAEGEEALALGPEPLELSLGAFCKALGERGGAVKNVLLDQHFLRGMGNIYTDEALFLAGIHPLTPASRVTRKKAAALYEAMRLLLQEAIDAGGSSISDYVDAEGRRGGFQDRHQVYGRAAQPCTRCGTLIRRMVVAQRGTHYCPRCQRLAIKRPTR